VFGSIRIYGTTYVNYVAARRRLIVIPLFAILQTARPIVVVVANFPAGFATRAFVHEMALPTGSGRESRRLPK